MPSQNHDATDFWLSWEEYFTAKSRKDPRTCTQAKICLDKLRELTGSRDEAACAQGLQKSFLDVSAQRAAEMYQQLVADAKAPAKDSTKEALRFDTFPPESKI
jgi:hypothetical protein